MLIEAVKNHNLHLSQYLIEKGANPYKDDYNGGNAYYYSRKDKNIRDYFNSKGLGYILTGGRSSRRGTGLIGLPLIVVIFVCIIFLFFYFISRKGKYR